MANEKSTATVDRMSQIKSLLNNTSLIRFVRKYSADNLCADNETAKGVGIAVTAESVTIGDTTMSKILVTQASYKGEEFQRYNLKQVKDCLEVIGGDKAEKAVLIVGNNKEKNLFVEVDDTVIAVMPVAKSDRKE